ncbi:YscG family type III secretion system chaperone [Pseudomonas sp. MWU13-3659]|uniref:YscG family type III secretion system chaperone n=1 Tax=Pseudomonas sp. MWU13-3659 TaxID=2986964 RepID=UPI002075234D|nr:YscG family type III secretion system chaperone [Pseudomonas sp. MWU13-3659]
MDMTLENLLARVGMLGVEHNCNDEALLIARWLALEPATQEAAAMLRISSLMGLGRCDEALAEGNKAPWPSLGPWLALCERRLGCMAALDRRLDSMLLSDDPGLVAFARGMCLGTVQ